MMTEEGTDNTTMEEGSDSSSATIMITENEVFYDIKQMKMEAKRLRAEEKLKMQQEEIQIRKEKAIQAMQYLLKNSEKYTKYFVDKLQNKNNTKSRNPLQNRKKHADDFQINEKEFAELQKKQNTDAKTNEENVAQTRMMAQPKYFLGTLYGYQMEGLSWLKLLFENGINGILADEMGLGKTIQVIALICYLIEQLIPGPFLIVAPLSTIPNWISEFKRFAPKIPVILFHGPSDVRSSTYSKIQKIYTVDGFCTRPVVITSYQMPLVESKFLRMMRWQYVIIDEGHKIKNSESKLFREMKALNSLNRLLLTGTPLQNNLQELWSLLNFLLPQIFQNKNTFGDLFAITDFNESDTIIKQEKDTNIISTIHGVLNPFMLRRLKSDVLKDLVPKKEILVYCPLSELQTNLYRYVLQKNIAKLTGKEEENLELSMNEGRKRRKCTINKKYIEMNDSNDEFELDSPDIFENDYCRTIAETDKKEIHRQVNMCNTMMIMRKIVNHPFTIHCPVIAGTSFVKVDKNVVTQCGKMMVLNAMLTKLKKRGHKVLLFCTFTSVLDFIEDYLILQNLTYRRLDGKCKLHLRQESIDEFNTNPDIFVFLISTRAGSLGLNLTAADTVILYDRDWNPQQDIQAQDRCHRLGQTKPVMVYSLISKGTVDEYILTRATAKRRLEKIVIKKGKFTNPEHIFKSATDLKELEELLNSEDHEQVIHSNGFVLTNKELDRLLDRSELYKEMEKRKVNNKENAH